MLTLFAFRTTQPVRGKCDSTMVSITPSLVCVIRIGASLISPSDIRLGLEWCPATSPMAARCVSLCRHDERRFPAPVVSTRRRGSVETYQETIRKYVSGHRSGARRNLLLRGRVRRRPMHTPPVTSPTHPNDPGNSGKRRSATQ